MTKPELTERQLNNMHKVVFLANQYHHESLFELSKLFDMPMIDSNNAIRAAEEWGYLVVDKHTGGYSVDTVPEKWEFGKEVQNLTDELLFMFRWLAEDETDLHEQELNVWLGGYRSMDYGIVLNVLLDNRTIVTYDVINTVQLPAKSKKARVRGEKGETVKDTYVFYTLFENLEQQWGRKQFNADQLL
jgi:hypothetical protein